MAGSNDTFEAAVMGDDDSVVLVGSINGIFRDEESSDSPPSSDFAAVKLDSDGKELWRWQVSAACRPRSVYHFFMSAYSRQCIDCKIWWQ